MGSFGKKEVTRREGFEGVPLVDLSRDDGSFKTLRKVSACIMMRTYSGRAS